MSRDPRHSWQRLWWICSEQNPVVNNVWPAQWCIWGVTLVDWWVLSTKVETSFQTARLRSATSIHHGEQENLLKSVNQVLKLIPCNKLRERQKRNDLDWLGNYRTNSVNKKISWNCKSYKTFESGPKTKCNRFCRWVGWIGCAITRPTTWTRKYHTTQNLTKLWRFWNSSHARDCCVGLSMIDGSGTTWTGWGITGHQERRQNWKQVSFEFEICLTNRVQFS